MRGRVKFALYFFFVGSGSYSIILTSRDPYALPLRSKTDLLCVVEGWCVGLLHIEQRGEASYGQHRQ
jgi:hypothetical protein